MLNKTTVTIDHISTDVLHPLYAQYDGQVTAQPSYVELDLDSGTLSADYSSAVGGGVPIRVWEGEVVRFDIDPQLTAAEINSLLDEIAPLAQELIDAREDAPSGALWEQQPVLDANFKIQQVCERRTTESGGIWDAKQWIEADGLNPALSDGPFFPPVAKEINLRHDSSDADLDEIAKTLRGIAEDDGLITLENVDEYLVAQRDILRDKKGAE